MSGDYIEPSMLEESVPSPNWSETVSSVWSKELSARNGTTSPEVCAGALPVAVPQKDRAPVSAAGEVCPAEKPLPVAVPQKDRAPVSAAGEVCPAEKPLPVAVPQKDRAPVSAAGEVCPAEKPLPVAVPQKDRAPVSAGGEVCPGALGTGKAAIQSTDIELPSIKQESVREVQKAIGLPTRANDPIASVEALLLVSKSAAEIAYRGLKDSNLPQSLIPLSRGEGIFFPETVPFQKDPPVKREPAGDSSFYRGLVKGLMEGIAPPIKGLLPFDAPKTGRDQPPRGVAPRDNSDTIHDKQGQAAHGDDIDEMEESKVRKLFREVERAQEPRKVDQLESRLYSADSKRRDEDSEALDYLKPENMKKLLSDLKDGQPGKETLDAFRKLLNSDSAVSQAVLNKIVDTADSLGLSFKVDHADDLLAIDTGEQVKNIRSWNLSGSSSFFKNEEETYDESTGSLNNVGAGPDKAYEISPGRIQHAGREIGHRAHDDANINSVEVDAALNCLDDKKLEQIKAELTNGRTSAETLHMFQKLLNSSSEVSKAVVDKILAQTSAPSRLSYGVDHEKNTLILQDGGNKHVTDVSTWDLDGNSGDSLLPLKNPKTINDLASDLQDGRPALETLQLFSKLLEQRKNGRNDTLGNHLASEILRDVNDKLSDKYVSLSSDERKLNVWFWDKEAKNYTWKRETKIETQPPTRIRRARP